MSLTLHSQASEPQCLGLSKAPESRRLKADENRLATAASPGVCPKRKEQLTRLRQRREEQNDLQLTSQLEEEQQLGEEERANSGRQMGPLENTLEVVLTP